MREQVNTIQNQAPPGRDYSRLEDVAQAVERLVAGLEEDGDDPRMFQMLGEVLEVAPEIAMPIIRGSIDIAAQKLGQDRRGGSSATLLYPIDTAVRVIAAQRQLLDDPFSASSWDAGRLAWVMENYGQDIIELAGSNTTSKNLPQRAAHILWLLDQCPLVKPGQQCAFLEIGASGGLILDALRQPDKFRNWMAEYGYRTDFAQKNDAGQQNAVLGIDLVRPTMDWLQAVIPDDGIRAEAASFVRNFERSPVIVQSATALAESGESRNFLLANKDALPTIFSCFVFYQLDEVTREQVTQQARALLREQGGGLLIVSDIAKYRGFPDKAGGCVSWVEDQDGNRVSPAIFISKATLTEWEEV